MFQHSNVQKSEFFFKTPKQEEKASKSSFQERKLLIDSSSFILHGNSSPLLTSVASEPFKYEMVVVQSQRFTLRSV